MKLERKDLLFLLNTGKESFTLSEIENLTKKKLTPNVDGKVSSGLESSSIFDNVDEEAEKEKEKYDLEDCELLGHYYELDEETGRYKMRDFTPDTKPFWLE